MTAGVLERRAIDVAGRRISYLVKGAGEPVTIYLHGLGADAESTRPLAGGVPGRCVLMDFPSHGQSENLSGAVTFTELVEVVRTVARAEGATRALGVSLGSAVLLRWLVSFPDELERAVLYLPTAISRPRPAGRLRRALSNEQALAEYVAGELPEQIASTPLAQRWMSTRSRALRRAGIPAYAELLEGEAPVPDPSAVQAVATELLAVGAEGDRLHPVAAAHEAAECFPHAAAQIFAEAAPLWTGRRELRRILAGFLGGSDTVGR